MKKVTSDAKQNKLRRGCCGKIKSDCQSLNGDTTVSRDATANPNLGNAANYANTHATMQNPPGLRLRHVHSAKSTGEAVSPTKGQLSSASGFGYR